MIEVPLLLKTDRKLAVLIDPDKLSEDELFDFVARMNQLRPDFLLLGGSLIYKSNISTVAGIIKAACPIPLVLFPGHFTHLCDEVDAVLLLSLISGRNPDLLIGQHVLSAPRLKELSHKLWPTGYLLIDGGSPTSVSYMSQTQPIPRDKTDIAICTAMAGEALGLQCIYLDAGSGARHAVPPNMIRGVSEAVDLPVIIGGGIRSTEQLEACWSAGANLVVIGNAIEENPAFTGELEAIRRNTGFTNTRS